MYNILNSPINIINFNNQKYYIKRDDLLNSDFSGNKARKFYYFLKKRSLLTNTIVSYGSIQSNAMYSLSVLAKLKKYSFIYYVHHLPTFLENNPQGNLKYSLKNGMVLKIGNWENEQRSYNKLFISEGGAVHKAKIGIKNLANEINQWQKINNIKNLKIFLPSGTGTTALFLQRYLQNKVLTCPCVGDNMYLKKQFLQLERNPKYHPTIIDTHKKFHFGKLYKENYQIWEALKQQTNIEFDLLYDPIGWQTLLRYNDNNNILYIHQGGLKGNETMLARYKKKV